jgi:hypothetical protein
MPCVAVGKILVSPSWPDFVPAIHAFMRNDGEDEDAGHEAGHDELDGNP